MNQVWLTDNFRVTPDGLRVTGDPSYQEWVEAGRALAGYRRMFQFAIADWINQGETRYGETYAQALDVLGLEYSTLSTYAWVGRAVTSSTRREHLSFSHHRAVASLPPQEQVEVLDLAEAGGWTRQDTRDEVARRKGTPTLPASPDTAVCPVCGGCGRVPVGTGELEKEHAR